MILRTGRVFAVRSILPGRRGWRAGAIRLGGDRASHRRRFLRTRVASGQPFSAAVFGRLRITHILYYTRPRLPDPFVLFFIACTIFLLSARAN